MKVVLIHGPSGKRLSFPATQVVVTDDTDRPLAVSYEATPGTIIHSDATDVDFGEVCSNLGLKTEPVKLIKV